MDISDSMIFRCVWCGFAANLDLGKFIIRVQIGPLGAPPTFFSSKFYATSPKWDLNLKN
jgi:hypothetical protein